MPVEPEKTFPIACRLEVLQPGLTRDQVKAEAKRSPGTVYCRAAIVLALTSEKALAVVSSDARVFPIDGCPMSAQTQFEMWLLYTEGLRADPDLPNAMRIFLAGVIASYREKVNR